MLERMARGILWTAAVAILACSAPQKIETKRCLDDKTEITFPDKKSKDKMIVSYNNANKDVGCDNELGTATFIHHRGKKTYWAVVSYDGSFLEGKVHAKVHSYNIGKYDKSKIDTKKTIVECDLTDKKMVCQPSSSYLGWFLFKVKLGGDNATEVLRLAATYTLQGYTVLRRLSPVSAL